MKMTESLENLSKTTHASSLIKDAGVHHVPMRIIGHDDPWALVSPKVQTPAPRWAVTRSVSVIIHGHSEHSRGATYMRVVPHKGKLPPYPREPGGELLLSLSLVGRRLERLCGKDEPIARPEDQVDFTKLTHSNTLSFVVDGPLTGGRQGYRNGSLSLRIDSQRRARMTESTSPFFAPPFRSDDHAQLRSRASSGSRVTRRRVYRPR